MKNKNLKNRIVEYEVTDKKRQQERMMSYVETIREKYERRENHEL